MTKILKQMGILRFTGEYDEYHIFMWAGIVVGIVIIALEVM